MHHLHHHDHHHGHHHHAPSNPKSLLLAFFLNLGFAIIEIIGGVLTGSMAILADALHDLGDAAALGSAWYFEKLAAKGRDKNFSYGYRRFSALGAFINSLIILTGSVVLIWHAVPKLYQATLPHTSGMIGLAIGGVLVNGFGFIKLKNEKGINFKAAALHLLEDVLGWAAVLVGAIVMHFTQWAFIDPLLSIGIAVFLLFNVAKNFKALYSIFLQAMPAEVDQKRIEQLALQIDGVYSIHDFHCWTLDGEITIASLHVVMKTDTDTTQWNKTKEEIRHVLLHENIQHVTIEMEPEGSMCVLENC